MRLSATIYREALAIRKTLDRAARRRSAPYDRSLEGACAVASVALQERLDKVGRHGRVFIGRSHMFDFPQYHCWVETATHLIDLTYTQVFPKCPKVYTLSKASHAYHDYRACFVKIRPVYSVKTQFQRWTGTENPRYWKYLENPQ